MPEAWQRMTCGWFARNQKTTPTRLNLELLVAGRSRRLFRTWSNITIFRAARLWYLFSPWSPTTQSLLRH
jgi:hypothetical protein